MHQSHLFKPCRRLLLLFWALTLTAMVCPPAFAGTTVTKIWTDDSCSQVQFFFFLDYSDQGKIDKIRFVIRVPYNGESPEFSMPIAAGSRFTYKWEASAKPGWQGVSVGDSVSLVTGYMSVQRLRGGSMALFSDSWFFCTPDFSESNFNHFEGVMFIFSSTN